MLAVVSALLLSLSPQKFEVRVDPRIELLTTVFRLADAWEFRMEGSDSAYTKSVDAYFAPYKRHPTVEMARQVRESRGIGFDAVTILAVNLSDIDTLAERIPFNQPPARWDSRWRPDEARAFVAKLKEFVKDTRYKEFLAQQQPYISKATRGLSDLLKSHDVSDWLHSFYGMRPSREPFVIVGLLCGGGNYGMSVQFPDGSVEMSPIFGASRYDGEGFPVYDESTLPTILHEFSHGYVNPLVRPLLTELKPAAESFMQRLEPVFRANAYGSEEAVLYETFVRAAESYLVRKHLGKELSDQNMLVQRFKGFLWTSDLVEHLGSYEKNRTKYRTFADFFPQLKEAFKRLAKNPEAIYKRCPQVLACDFAVKGENEVTIRVQFDRPMRTDSRGISLQPDGWTTVEKTRFAKDARSLEITVKVEKGKEFEVAVNRFGGGLLSQSGYPVLPYFKKLRR